MNKRVNNIKGHPSRNRSTRYVIRQRQLAAATRAHVQDLAARGKTLAQEPKPRPGRGIFSRVKNFFTRRT